MTVAHTRGCKRIHSNAGFVPVIEDWHAKVTLLGVCSV